MDHEYFVWQD
jgi:hypothetical protein